MTVSRPTPTHGWVISSAMKTAKIKQTIDNVLLILNNDPPPVRAVHAELIQRAR